ncbi:histone-like nucleoid-structuring protein Lsr2 [Clavibacter michiganensis]|uniref:histone-like nucleoid-structuring protein Lsr2 n=1 Tax=Clavibacter michiganensis TaxID=28447 RepID=UPI0026DA9CE4|nr:Lsr2 family protein [Clavibacter michiganensis]MDO4039273.1 Lsr2 family protein [Clavibacter michiganensis]MDO4063910.1 Lsr2 family protein [Clavibacter michiganensis]MDO4110231.1 Lsr2 family protein [Clavibacter michiganensis]MDO4113409.1 Lsr2 family protein [Clavibacter michiganensis]MDO4116745.1 Lsr2 family protein [Clavibacter michiganensis]
MAKKTTTQLVDDIDGTVLDEDGTTVSFSVDGTDYEIDLGPEHAEELREAFAPYIAAGRKAASGRRGPAPRPLSKAANSGDAAERSEAREWLRDNGHKVGVRGRISAELMALFRDR